MSSTKWTSRLVAVSAAIALTAPLAALELAPPALPLGGGCELGVGSCPLLAAV